MTFFSVDTIVTLSTQGYPIVYVIS